MRRKRGTSKAVQDVEEGRGSCCSSFNLLRLIACSWLDRARSSAGKLSFRKTVALHVQRSDLQYPISAIWDTVFLHKVQTQCLVLKRCDFPS